MTAEGQKITETTHNKWQDLVWPGDCGRTRFLPGAYLADGAEYLDHAACKLDHAVPRGFKPSGLPAFSCKDVSLLYPCEEGAAVITKTIPFSGLVLQLHPLCKSGYRVGIPVRVHEVLRGINTRKMGELVEQRPAGKPGLSDWLSHDLRHNEHIWIYADTAVDFKAFVYVDGNRGEVNASDLLRQTNKNLKCDALTLLCVQRDRSDTEGPWKLGMTILDLLITDTTTVSMPQTADDELVGCHKYSSAEVVNALVKLQRGPGKGVNRA